MEVLRGLDPFGEVLLVQGLVDARPEETDECARLCRGDMPERPPRREHSTRRGIAQVDEVAEMRRLVCCHGRGDLDHLHERERAFLHSGAARGRRREQGESFRGGPFDRGDDPFGCRDTDRSGEEGELAGDQRDPASVDGADSGEYRLVDPGPLSGTLEFGAVGVIGVDVDRGFVPRDETALVEHRIDELLRRDSAPSHLASLSASPRATVRGFLRRRGGGWCEFDEELAPTSPSFGSSGRELPSM